MSKNITTWPAYVGNLTISTIGGTITQGLQGGVTALSATIADEFLINRGYTAKHYLTSSALWGALVAPVGQALAETFPEWSTLIYGSSLATIGAISYYGNDPLNYQKKIEDTNNSLAPIVELFDEENVLTKKELDKVYNLVKSNPYEGVKVAIKDLNYILHNKLLVTQSAKIAIDTLEVYINNSCNKYIGNNGTTMLALTLIQSNPMAGALELGYIGLKISSILFGKSLISSALGLGKSYIEADLRKSINKQSIDQLLLNKEHLHKILGINESSAITANLNNDLQNCLMYGETLLRSITSDKIKEISALNEVMILAPEALILQQIRGFFKKSITELVQKKLSEHQQDIAKIDAAQYSIVSDLCTNFGNAVLTDSTEFIKTKHNHNMDKKTLIEFKSMLWNQFSTISSSALEVAEKFIDIVYYTYKITNGHFTIEQAPFLYSWLQEASPLLQGGFTLNFPAAVVGQDRVHKLLKAISSVRYSNYSIPFI